MQQEYWIEEIQDIYFDYFRNIVYRESGIKLSDSKKALMQSRLVKRLRALELCSYEEYAGYLKDNYELEIINFINAITTNKTDFFREAHHFHFLEQVVFPLFDKIGKDEIRIWSAGCSTGEEPYSIAMVCKEYYNDKGKPEIKILATDIDTQVLSKAIGAVYDSELITAIPHSIRDRYFLKGVGENSGLCKLKPGVREMITFKRLNLLDVKYPMQKKFDIIFCRNVIIYFDKDTQKTLFEKMYSYLDQEGFLFIGHSENIKNISDKFCCIEHTIYRKN